MAVGPEFRRGLVHYPPVKITEARPRSPRYLSEQERIVIADLLAAKMTVRGIAAHLGRSPSTIVARSAATAIRTGGIAPITQSMRLEPVLASLGRGGSLLMRFWPSLSRGCWPSAGAQSRSRTSCVICSSGSAGVGCVPSRSIRRSTTRRWLSLARHAVVVAADVYSACSDVGG